MEYLHDKLSTRDIMELLDRYCSQTDPLGDTGPLKAELELYGDYGAEKRFVMHTIIKDPISAVSSKGLSERLQIPGLIDSYELSCTVNPEEPFTGFLIRQETEIFSEEFDQVVRHIHNVTSECHWQYDSWNCEVLSLAPIEVTYH